MELFVFSSKTLTNIWAGIGARKWAVSLDQAANPGIATKAKALRIGSIGILYCVETQSLTTPFIVASLACGDRDHHRCLARRMASSFRHLSLGVA